jgi:hypothetical protein
MPAPDEDIHTHLSPLEEGVEETFGPSEGWSRGKRMALSSLAMVVYLLLATFEAGFLALLLGVGLFGVLDRWHIDDSPTGRAPDAYLWAGVCAVIAVGTFSIWWWYLGPEELQRWSTHVWFPIAVVSIALAFHRYRRPATPVESIGQALAAARQRHPRTLGEKSGEPEA